jgi:adenosylcobinamide-GDP ribazoletransferase
MGAALARNAPGSLPLLLAAQYLIVTIVFVSAWGVAGIMSVLGAGLFFLYWRRVLIKRLGGTTGDTAGALVELTETLLLLTLAIFC